MKKPTHLSIGFGCIPNPKAWYEGEINNEPSLTIPDQAEPMQDMVQRWMNGDLIVAKEGVYNLPDDYDYEHNDDLTGEEFIMPYEKSGFEFSDITEHTELAKAYKRSKKAKGNAIGSIEHKDKGENQQSEAKDLAEATSKTN